MPPIGRASSLALAARQQCGATARRGKPGMGGIAGSEDCGGVILKENDVLDIMTFVGGG